MNKTILIVDDEEDILDLIEYTLTCEGYDYITKPFNINELKARVNAMMRRTGKTQDIIKYKDIIYNDTNILLSRDTLLSRIWGDSQNRQAKTVNVAIKRLKQSIDPKGQKNYIQAIREEGYIFC